MPNKGTSLVETMVAFLILSAIGVAVIRLTIQILALNTTAKLNNQGTSYAEEAVEQGRNFYQTSGYPALAALAPVSPAYYSDGTFSPGKIIIVPPGRCNITDCPQLNTTTGVQIGTTGFFRCVILNPPSSGTMKTQVVVSWLDRSVCKQTELDTYFSRY